MQSSRTRLYNEAGHSLHLRFVITMPIYLVACCFETNKLYYFVSYRRELVLTEYHCLFYHKNAISKNWLEYVAANMK